MLQTACLFFLFEFVGSSLRSSAPNSLSLSFLFLAFVIEAGRPTNDYYGKMKMEAFYAFSWLNVIKSSWFTRGKLFSQHDPRMKIGIINFNPQRAVTLNLFPGLFYQRCKLNKAKDFIKQLNSN